MDLQTLTYIVVGITFALYIGIAIWARAGSTKEFYVAGGGVNPGYVHGQTDELGYGVDSGPVHVNDFNATLLHLLGLNHEKLTYRAFGLDQRLTGVEEHHVVREVLA